MLQLMHGRALDFLGLTPNGFWLVFIERCPESRHAIAEKLARIRAVFSFYAGTHTIAIAKAGNTYERVGYICFFIMPGYTCCFTPERVVKSRVIYIGGCKCNCLSRI